MIIVIGSILTKTDKVSDALALSVTHVKRSQKEAGCLSHTVSVDCEDSRRLIFVERWVDMAALQVHFTLDDSQQFVRDLTPLLSEKPKMKIYQANEVQA